MHGDAGPGSGGDCLPSSPEPIQGAFGSVFFGVVEVLAIVPVSCCKSLTLNRDLAGPSCATASTIRHDLKGGGHDMGITASLFEAFLPG